MKDKTVSLEEILKGVSRSFYLSLRLLPEGVRAPISLGYLLARASDTIADTETVSVQTRADLLQAYREAVSAETLPELTIRLEKDFIPHVPDEREQLLMRRLPDIEKAVNELNAEMKAEVHWVLGPIIDGQMWDLTYFQGKDVMQTESETQLLDYTYMVAGCVGEFWTKVGFLDSADYATESRDNMLLWGKHYGQALQLINILRDESRDLELGRIYFPNGERKKWLEQARTWLDEGMTYCRALSRRRLRMPTVLPALIGYDTLDLLEKQGSGVKVTRKDVYANLWQALIFESNN